jgi:hypothetical protein
MWVLINNKDFYVLLINKIIKKVMKLKPKTTILEHFGDIDDPRIERSKLHKLPDIMTIAICAVICGADTWEDIELFGNSKNKWFKEFLELPNGIPEVCACRKPTPATSLHLMIHFLACSHLLTLYSFNNVSLIGLNLFIS